MARATTTRTVAGAEANVGAGRAAQRRHLPSEVSGKRDWEQTFDAIADPIAVFDSRARAARQQGARRSPRSRGDDAAWRGLRRRRLLRGHGAHAWLRAPWHTMASQTEVTLPDGQIFSVTTFPVAAAGRRIGRPGRQERHRGIGSKRRLEQMSDELALANARLVAALDRLKSTQAQLLQAEKLSAIGQLVAGVAHELNNPLTSVIGYAQLLEDELDTPGDDPHGRRARAGPAPDRARNRSARRESSAICWPLPVARRPSARRRTWRICSAA